MKKKSTTDMPTATILGRRIVDWIITGNKGTKGPSVMETNKKMEEI